MKENTKIAISLCMIAKNEAEQLSRCLESVMDLVKEIIIVDTGSTDNTVEIAEAYGAKVFHHSWTGNFSEARNVALKHATGDWILSIDADEELKKEDIHLVKEAIKDDDVDGIRCVIHSTSNHTSALTKSHFTRLFRNNRGIYYEGTIHEIPIIAGKTIASNIRIIHHGYAIDKDKMMSKLDTYLQLLQKQLKEEPDNPTTHFYLAKTYYLQKHNKGVLREGKEVIRLLPDDVIKVRPELEIYLILACALFESDNLQEAEKMCLKALELKSNYIDPPFFLGKMYFSIGKYEDAVLHLHKYFQIKWNLEINHDASDLVMHSLTGSHEAHFMLGIIYEKQGKYMDAIKELKRAIEIDPKYAEAYNALGIVYSIQSRYQQAILAFKEAIRIKPDFVMAYKNLGVAYANHKEFTLAAQAFDAAIKIVSPNADNDDKHSCLQCIAG
ncbi:MAG: glycosyltransferase [Candidatus Brocadiales bacterium]